MKYLDSYLNFILESKKIDKLDIVYSDSFRSILRNINSYLSSKLLSIESIYSNNYQYEYTLIDVTKENDKLSFIQSSRIINSDEYSDYIKAMKINNPDLSEEDYINDVPPSVIDKEHKFWKSSRNNIGVGKFTKKILNSVLSISIADSDLEKFVNDFKRHHDEMFSEKVLELISGEEIRKYYNEDNYESDKGELGSSCMRQPKKSRFFDIYVKNPEVCQLLILRSANNPDLIKGRSLIWKLTDGSYYQDRVYTNNNYEVELFKDWAKEKDMKLYYDEHYDIEVQLGDHEYDFYPYMDTFVCYNPSKKLLSANEDLWPGQGFIKLQDTQGGYESGDVVWSDVEDEYIDKDEAVWVKISNSEHDWVYSHNVIDLGERGQWYQDSHDIKWCNQKDRYLHRDDLVYSNITNEWLYDYVKVKTESGAYKSGEDYIPKEKKNLYSIEIEEKIYLRKDLIKNPDTGEFSTKNYDLLKELSNKLESKLTIDKAKDIINKNYLNGDFDKSLIKEELKKMNYDFEFDLDTTILLLYVNMSGGYFEDSHDSYTRIRKIKSHIVDIFKKDSNVVEDLNSYYWFNIQKVISNFNYWIFDKEVYEAYLYLNVL
jgi:hypothetical protein